MKIVSDLAKPCRLYLIFLTHSHRLHQKDHTAPSKNNINNNNNNNNNDNVAEEIVKPSTPSLSNGQCDQLGSVVTKAKPNQISSKKKLN